MQANLDMRGGWRGDDNGVSLHLVNQSQGIGQALCDAKSGADRLERGGICVRHARHLDV